MGEGAIGGVCLQTFECFGAGGIREKRRGTRGGIATCGVLTREALRFCGLVLNSQTMAVFNYFRGQEM